MGVYVYVCTCMYTHVEIQSGYINCLAKLRSSGLLSPHVDTLAFILPIISTTERDFIDLEQELSPINCSCY